MTDKQTKQFAKDLRKNLTIPELKLWDRVRAKLAGLKSRRQHAIENYIVDFVCLSKSLIIELDGESHAERGNYDLVRQECLETKGFRVLRFSNDNVLNEMDDVLNAILMACDIDPDSKLDRDAKTSVQKTPPLAPPQMTRAGDEEYKRGTREGTQESY